MIIDLRPDSPTYEQWDAVELAAENYRALYVPEQFAHGYQTLEDNSEVFYQMNEFFAPEASGGIRFDDPAFGIIWPFPDPVISTKDRSYPLYVPISL